VSWKQREKKFIVYGVVAVVAFLVAMAPVYYNFARYVLKPVWYVSSRLGEFSFKTSRAWQCFTATSSVDIVDIKNQVYTASGAYTYGYITEVRWLGDIKEFYVKTATNVPSGLDAVVVSAGMHGFIGKVDACDVNGCWVISLWDSRLHLPVFLKPSGYIGWLRYSSGKWQFYSVSAPLEPVKKGQGVYWLGNPIVYIGQTTSTLSVAMADVSPVQEEFLYTPVFIYVEVDTREEHR